MFFEGIKNFFINLFDLDKENSADKDKKDEATQENVSIFGTEEFENYANSKLKGKDESVFSLDLNNSYNFKIEDDKIVATKNKNQLKEAQQLLDFMNEFIDDEKFIETYDLNKDGKTNINEVHEFIVNTRASDGNKNDLSVYDLISANELYLEKEASAGTGADRKKPAEETQNTDKIADTASETTEIKDEKTQIEELTIEEKLKLDTIPSELSMALDNKLGNGFCAKVEKMAEKYNFNPNDLLQIMYLESRLDPTTTNSINAAGLIQFIPSTAKNLGYSTEDILKMNAVEQLDVVEEYFKRNIEWKKKVLPETLDLGTLYSLVFLPNRAGNDVLCTKEEGFYSGNKGLDYNNDGQITKKDVVAKIETRFNDLLSELNLV